MLYQLPPSSNNLNGGGNMWGGGPNGNGGSGSGAIGRNYSADFTDFQNRGSGATQGMPSGANRSMPQGGSISSMGNRNQNSNRSNRMQNWFKEYSEYEQCFNEGNGSDRNSPKDQNYPKPLSSRSVGQVFSFGPEMPSDQNGDRRNSISGPQDRPSMRNGPNMMGPRGVQDGPMQRGNRDFRNMSSSGMGSSSRSDMMDRGGDYQSYWNGRDNMISPGLPQDGAWSMEVEHSVKHGSGSSNNSASISPNNSGSPNSPGSNSPHSSQDNSSSSPSRKRRRLVSTRSLRIRDDGPRENATPSSSSMNNPSQGSWNDQGPLLHPPPLVRQRRSPRHHLSSNNNNPVGNNGLINGHQNGNGNGPPHMQSSPPPLRRARYRDRNSWPEGITPLFQTTAPSTHQPSLVVDINV
ncbi:uncharacterized protein DDB_G0283357-like [Ctenocephalides felis]|uniref:uncharacterized protein DDB_G0283357-like n=1 Tax=Ctenocephalides felis TaxID=7515 RepID=UPI000E6E3752|nr:uncharacterized protein DDB_G0283357-like [Ctenocephalides felis]